MAATDNAGKIGSPESAVARPFGIFEWMVARRYISATKSGAGVSLISIIAFVGILLAVAVLIVVMSVMQGFRAKLLDQLLGVNGHVFIEAQVGNTITDFDQILSEVKAVEGVTSALPIVQSPVYATANGETAAAVFGIRPDDLRSIDLVAGEGHLLFGSLESFGEGRKGGNRIAIGLGLANKLGVDVGDAVNLITSGGAETPMGTSPIRDKAYEVGAIFQIGMSEYDGILIYMPLEQAQVFFKRGDAIDKIEVRVTDPQRVTEFEDNIALAGGPGTFTNNWQDLHESYFNALQTERAMMRIILLLIVAVAMLNIITGLVMLVKDKTGDIAVMRTIGATQGSVMRIFFLSGSMIGVVGTICGVLLGALISLNVAGIEKFLSKRLGIELFPAEVYLFDEMPAQMQAGEVLTVAGFALLMAFLSTLYPAWRAARLDPVEALRYE